jgi:hypothetical protein
MLIVALSIPHLQSDVEAQEKSKIKLHGKETGKFPLFVFASNDTVMKLPSLENTALLSCGSGGSSLALST